MINIRMLFFAAMFFVLSINLSVQAKANGIEGCGAKDCKECHKINRQDVEDIFKKLNAKHIRILDIRMSPVKGLWEVSMEDKGQRGVIYIDFSKNYAVTGSIISVQTGLNVTQKKAEELEKDRRVDVSKIPLNDALIMGNPKASKKVVMFTDPG